jgi:hypothetical protein
MSALRSITDSFARLTPLLAVALIAGLCLLAPGVAARSAGPAGGHRRPAHTSVGGASARERGANARVRGANARVRGANARIRGANARIRGASTRERGAKTRERCPAKPGRRTHHRGRSQQPCAKTRVGKRGPTSPPRSTPLARPAEPGEPPLAAGEPASSSEEGEAAAGSTSPAGQSSSQPGGAASEVGGEASETVSDPIDPKYLTEVPFGTRSFWVQPWRAYLDTWPASRLLDALGVNFNVDDADADATAQLLQESGFKLARIEVNWSALSYEDPTKFVDEAHIRSRFQALREHGLRPLILLDANSEAPTPADAVTLETTAPAPAGAQTVKLTPASAAAVVPGKTGFDKLSFGGDPDILITAVGPGDSATLSKPLPSALAAGGHRGATLLYAPFQAPRLPDGEANPAFAETLAGWLNYVATVSHYAASIFGPEGYDLEVWNELSFGSQFLNSESYYTPASEGGEAAVTKEITKALLDETVAFARNPANGIAPGVGISDGFASETPFPSGAQAPLGLTALSKHLYEGPKTFPADYPADSIQPVNALGEADTLPGSSAPLFVPSYQSLFPEYYLTATETETIVRDLAPFTTYVYGEPHGREVGPPGGAPLQKWMTEYNLSTHDASVMGPDEDTPENTPLSEADKEHFQAKTLLRSLVSMVSKGMTREYFYAAAPGQLSIISKTFWNALQTNPNTYPGQQQGGETTTGLRNMLTRFQGPGPEGPTRQLKLTAITQNGNHAQFTGQNTPQHPSLYDREILAVFPFQTSPTSFAIPIYVMTRDLLTDYQPNAPTNDIHRFDLPDETFHITLTNLPETPTPPTITAYDPLRNETTPAHLTTYHANTATIEIAATDYPRILTLRFARR